MTRKKVTIQARELSEMDVSRVSLVKRGANRVPFRIIKSDGDSNMLDISKIFLGSFQKKDQTPAVIAIVLSKNADAEAYTKALADAGFEIDHVTESDDSSALMLTKSDEMEDAVAFKISDDAALIITGIQKGIQAWPDSNSFVENITKAGFAPSYRVANEILSETVGNIMFSEGDAVETKAAVSKALADFSGYVEAVMSTIPVQAFKAEGVIVTLEKGMLNEQDTADSIKQKAKDKKKADAKGKKDTTETKGEDEDAGEAESDSDESSEAADETAADDVVAEKDSTEDGAEGQPEADATDANADVLKALVVLTETIGAVKASVESGNKVLTDRLDGLDAKVKKTDEALAGTVHSEDSEDNSADHTKKDVQKADGEVSWDNVLDFGDVEFS